MPQPKKPSPARQSFAAPNSFPITAVPGIGPALASKLGTLGIHSSIDLLFHLPLRYQDRTRLQQIQSLRNGGGAVIEGQVVSSRIQFGKRRSLVCKISDASGSITLRFFHFSAAQKNQLSEGNLIRCYGEASLGRGGLELIHPEYQLFSNEQRPELEATLTPIYPSTEGLQQARWRKFMAAAFSQLGENDIPDLMEGMLDNLPGHFRLEPSARLSLYQVLKNLHFPPVGSDISLIGNGNHPLQRRLAFEELVAQRISQLLLRKRFNAVPAIPIVANNDAEMTLLAQLPFQLTSAQRRVSNEIIADFASPSPMMRLIQGDVGSGKTVVAAIASIHSIANSMQVALMAPTEILAGQHFLAFQQWFQPIGIDVVLLNSKMPAAEKRAALNAIQSGEAKMVVGTHALIQDSVEFNELGLVIIDEQHRFGVEQRLSLNKKRNDHNAVHQLVMTATPIPRTLAMTFYAELDLSIIDELPPGRTPVDTVALGSDRRQQVIDRVSQACRRGAQAYWVCTLIEESELLQAQAAETTANELAQALAQNSSEQGSRVGLVHGRLSGDQKEKVMQAFKNGDIDLLVATTVIEVGVDVPNASLMIIENPERLGLAQLHQLRGRVGRGQLQSHCVLLYQTPLSKNARQRIDILRSTNDGFVLAEKDLNMRGPGEVLGKKQSGAASFRMADLERDADMIDAVVGLADKITDQQPDIAEALVERWCPLAKNYINV